MRQLVPELVVGERRKGHRAAHDAHRQRIDVARAEQPPGGEHQQAARHHQREEAEVRALHDNVTAQAQRGEVLVDHARRIAVQRRGRDMLALQIALGRPGARRHARGRVILGHQADDLVGHQPAQVQLARRLQPVADHQVDLPLRQAAPVVEGARQRQQLEPRLRRLVLEMRHQLGQEQRVEVVARGDAEGQRRLGGREAARAGPGAEQPVGVLQQAAGRLQQLQGRLGGRHAVARAHQQRIAGERAQPLELGAHRRLRAAQAHGGTGDAAFGDQGLQHPDEMKLDLVEIAALRHIASMIGVIRHTVSTSHRIGVPSR